MCVCVSSILLMRMCLMTVPNVCTNVNGAYQEARGRFNFAQAFLDDLCEVDEQVWLWSVTPIRNERRGYRTNNRRIRYFNTITTNVVEAYWVHWTSIVPGEGGV